MILKYEAVHNYLFYWPPTHSGPNRAIGPVCVSVCVQIIIFELNMTFDLEICHDGSHLGQVRRSKS